MTDKSQDMVTVNINEGTIYLVRAVLQEERGKLVSLKEAREIIVSITKNLRRVQ